MKKATNEHQITSMTESGELVQTSVSDREHLAMITELLTVLAAHVAEYNETHANAMCFRQYEALGFVETRLNQCTELLYSTGIAVPYEAESDS